MGNVIYCNQGKGKDLPKSLGGHKMDKLIVIANRDSYSINDIYNTMTVGDLKTFLDDMEDDTPIYLSFDGGYTYGAIRDDRMEVEYGDEEEEF